jgi:hypothetical protein
MGFLEQMVVEAEVVEQPHLLQHQQVVPVALV